MYCERFKETMTNESINNSPGRTCTLKVLMILSTIKKEVRFLCPFMGRATRSAQTISALTNQEGVEKSSERVP